MSFDDLHKATERAVIQAVDQICDDFRAPPKEGHTLASDKGLPMIPAFVTGSPNGTERGVLLAADLGGTNFRICSVNLHGDHTFSMEQMKSKIPDDLLDDENVTSDDLFGFLARRTLAFMKKYHPDDVGPRVKTPSP
ncbi:glucokinase [Fusarium falciforme]|nr:glucokinase [Fusarium falciforme]